jgi:hypothetical protein
MRAVKTEELRNEIEILSQNNQRELDSKEAFLQMLDKALDESDEQYQIALRNHLLHVQQLITLQDTRIQDLDEEFERDLKILKDEFLAVTENYFCICFRKGKKSRGFTLGRPRSSDT